MIKGKTVILPPAYMAPAAYYAAMLEADCVVIDTSMRYDRRAKAVHRTTVDGAHGPVFMTVPVASPTGSTWHDVAVSPHGRWWHIQESTLATLFGATPFFDYYRHDIAMHLTEAAVGHPVTDLDIALDMAVRRLIGITVPMSVAVDPRLTADDVVDLRRTDFYTIDMPTDLYPGRSILRALFEYGGDELHRRLADLRIISKIV